jgi:hypothetical protein
MAEDLIRYDILVQDALRGVLRKVLSEIAHTGLPGDHHFFITFSTRSPGVRLSSRLMARYAENMTVVLQHQYWDLAVTENAFEVSLSFGGVRERLHVPFSAVKEFRDPSAPFHVQFEPQGPLEGAADQPESNEPKLPAPATEAPAAQADKPGEKEKAKDGAAEGTAEVVRLDAFRKKN